MDGGERVGVVVEEDGALLGVAADHGWVGVWRVHSGGGLGFGLLDQLGVGGGDVLQGEESDDVATSGRDGIGAASLRVVEGQLFGLESRVRGELVKVWNDIGGV